MLELDYPIKDLVGADYNPREIDEESLKTLRQSIKTLGIVKPIIVSGNLIVAGHQRTKALLAAGIDKAPVYLLPENINQTDEIRFNQTNVIIWYRVLIVIKGSCLNGNKSIGKMMTRKRLFIFANIAAV